MNDDEKDVKTGGDHQPGSSTGEGSGASQAEIDALTKERDRLLTEVTTLRKDRRDLKTDTKPLTSDGTQTSAKDTDPVAQAAKERAVRVFKQKHPEYADDIKLDSLLGNYVPRRGTLLWEDISDDLEDAHFLLNRDAILESAKKGGTADALAKMSAADSADIGGTSGQPPKEEKKEVQLSDDEKKILSKLQKVDPSMTVEKFAERRNRITG